MLQLNRLLIADFCALHRLLDRIAKLRQELVVSFSKLQPVQSIPSHGRQLDRRQVPGFLRGRGLRTDCRHGLHRTRFCQTGHCPRFRIHSVDRRSTDASIQGWVNPWRMKNTARTAGLNYRVASPAEQPKS